MYNMTNTFTSKFDTTSSYWDPESYIDNSSPQHEAGKKLLEKYKFKGNEAVLDIGCGPGVLATDLAKIFPNSQITGIDSSANMIFYAGKSHTLPNLDFGIMDAEQINLLNKKFDLIVSTFCLHWVKDKTLLFNGIASSLANDGVALLIMPLHNQLLSKVRAKLMQSNQWKAYFQNYENPHRSVEDNDYKKYGQLAGLDNISYEIESGITIFDSLKKFALFLKNVNPCLEQLPNTKAKNAFIEEMIMLYSKEQPPDGDKYIMKHSYAKFYSKGLINTNTRG